MLTCLPWSTGGGGEVHLNPQGHPPHLPLPYSGIQDQVYIVPLPERRAPGGSKAGIFLPGPSFLPAFFPRLGVGDRDWGGSETGDIQNDRTSC